MAGLVYRRRSSSASLFVSPATGSHSVLRPEPNLIVRRHAPHSRSAASAHGLPAFAEGHGEERGGAGAAGVAGAAVQQKTDGRESRWKNYRTRCLWGSVMIAMFLALLASGHLAITLMVVGIQTAIFKEVISIAHLRSKEGHLPWFRTLNWYFLLCAYYFLFGESLIELFKDTLLTDAVLLPLVTHHHFISFCLYLLGLILFVLNLKKGHYKFQFNHFGLTHMTLLMVVCQSQFVIRNIFEGLFWFVLPVTLVIWNDIMAYFFGISFGRTPLIKLSPKKTWEGFLAAFVSTVLFGFLISGALATSTYLTCPVTDFSTTFFSGVSCAANPLFQKRGYPLPAALSVPISLLLPAPLTEITLYPVQLHALLLATFASLIAPFGGFFASGFKRAFKIKDFADSIPGHGGLTDRMDCQVMMGFFVYLYYSSFLKHHPLTAAAVLETAVGRLAPADQQLLYLRLHEYLVRQNMLPRL